jgi:transcription elongation factor Elf1
MPLHFTQSCPTCGRRVQVRASLVGYTVVCQHCSAEFEARAATGSSSSVSEEDADAHERLEDPLMIRVEEALKRAAAQSPLV